MNRRAFLSTLAAVGAAALNPWRRTSPPVGLSLRYVEHYDLLTEARPTRLDVLYGVATLRPDYVFRVTDE